MNNNRKTREQKDEEKARRRRIILYIIIIIIIILLLITSCSCTANYFGKLGDKCNCDDFTIDNSTNDKETIRNKDLRFDDEFLNISLSDSQVKVGFTYENIRPETFYCITSDPSIATCYVSDDFVVINPKSIGEVIVILQTEANGKIYEATMTVNVTDVTRYIDLSSNRGTIDLKYTNTKNIMYFLVGLSGDVKVASSDKSIASATVSDEYLKIKAYKEGTVTFTLSLTYNGMLYTKDYTLTIIDTRKGDKPVSGENKPGVGDDEPDFKSSDVSLKLLNVNGTSVLGTYYIKVNKSPVSFDAEPNDSKATIIYKGKEYSSLKDIPIELKQGNNTIYFTVEAEDGTLKDYTVIVNYDKNSADDDTNKYELEAPDEIDLRYTDQGAEKTFIIRTSNLFSGEVKTSKYGENGLKICSIKDNVCVYVTLPKEYSNYLKLESASGEVGPSSLAIKVKVTNPKALTDINSVPLTVWGEKDGTRISIVGTNDKSKDVIVNLIRCYVVELNANGGIFEDLGNGKVKDVYRFEIAPSKNEKIDVADYIPYIPVKDCVYYDFLGYSQTKAGSRDDIQYTSDDVIQNISDNLYLYALYSEAKVGDGNPLLKALWIGDLTLFNNEEGEKLYGDKKLIYPGANGTYTANFINDSDYKIALESLTLKENTVCVDTNNDGEKDGCLNMGYIVSIDPDPVTSKQFRYYYGAAGNKYEILNQNATMKDYYHNLNYVTLDLSGEEKDTVFVEKGSGFKVMISWKWINEEKYDKLDTLIGEYVTGREDRNYELSIGLKYYTIDEVCETLE